MLKIFIGPNGYGKTYELERIKKSFLFIILPEDLQYTYGFSKN